MSIGPASGYVFAIKDPRLTAQGKPDIVYVGNGRQPWLSVARHLQESSNLEMYEWSKGLFRDFPEGVEVLGREVCEAYHGEQVAIDPPKKGLTRVEWIILGEETDESVSRAQGDTAQLVVPLGTTKNYWVKKLRGEGHPLFNRSPGRPQRTS